jgi:peroxiredoxin (alkyl hydroperoxide reductase subunit C)
MPDKLKVGCARPTGGPVGGQAPEEAPADNSPNAAEQEEAMTMIQVGRPAPDFEAPAYHQGEFTSVKLSDHLGKWVVMCLYPGDFTFV